jgi:hypothetical protein
MVDFKGGGFGDVGARACEGDGAAVHTPTQGRLHLGFEPLVRLGEPDDSLEVLAVEGADLDEVVDPIALRGGLSKASHAADHAGHTPFKRETDAAAV